MGERVENTRFNQEGMPGLGDNGYKDEVRPPIEQLGGGRYRVEAILGAGGFGITYRCMDSASGRMYAVKEYMPEAIAARDAKTGWIVPELERRAAFLHGKKRFLEEAQILIRMSRIPSVVHVQEAFEENGTAYYVMEYLEGRTLKQVMRALGGKLPYAAAVEAVSKAGMALEEIHSRAGIFHRDISPENIMVMPDGDVKIIDFGSAKAMAVSENQQFSVVLKPGFAPPEQYASNMSQGSFTDVYALAGTFYYAASGRMIPPAPDRVMGAEYESLEKVVAECGRQASEAVDKALLLDARFRTQTMREFVEGIASGRMRSVSVPEVPGEPEEKNESDVITCQQEPLPEGLLRSRGGKEECPGQEPYHHAKAEPAAPAAWLRVEKGACAGQRFAVAAGRTVTVGRSGTKSEIRLGGHPEISGLHFKLLYSMEKHCFYVIDQSVNGLYYRSVRLEKGRKYKVMPRDALGVGSMNCVIVLEEA